MTKGRPKAATIPGDTRHPRTREAQGIPAGKRPRREFTPTEPDGKVVVLFSRIDVDSPWCLTKIEKSHHRDLLKHIRSFESMSVNEVFHQSKEPGKDYPLPDLPNAEARERLRELDLDDRDQISRLRIGGAGRLYGFREGERFYALWWDPHHMIWPSRKRNT